jgi:hypothetical protein
MVPAIAGFRFSILTAHCRAAPDRILLRRLGMRAPNSERFNTNVVAFLPSRRRDPRRDAPCRRKSASFSALEATAASGSDTTEAGSGASGAWRKAIGTVTFAIRRKPIVTPTRPTTRIEDGIALPFLIASGYCRGVVSGGFADSTRLLPLESIRVGLSGVG